MSGKSIWFVGLGMLVALVLVGCGAAPTPTSAPAPTRAPTAAASNVSAAVPPASQSTGTGFEMKSNEGGSVTVNVTPTTLAVGEPVAFKIVMDTHSVELTDDMTKISILRDDTGKEYKPTAWEGPGGGGHHREGTLKFAALTSKPKYVEIVIKGLAKVNERVFRWELP